MADEDELVLCALLQTVHQMAVFHQGGHCGVLFNMLMALCRHRQGVFALLKEQLCPRLLGVNDAREMGGGESRHSLHMLSMAQPNNTSRNCVK